MKDIRQSLICLYFGLSVTCFIGFWIICDYLFTTFISHHIFLFDVGCDILLPLIISIPLAVLVTALIRKKLIKGSKYKT